MRVTIFACAILAVLVTSQGWGVPDYRVGVQLPELGTKAGVEQEADAYQSSTLIFTDLWRVRDRVSPISLWFNS